MRRAEIIEAGRNIVTEQCESAQLSTNRTYQSVFQIKSYIFFSLYSNDRLESKYRGNKKYSKVPFIITGVICFVSMLIVAILIGVIDAPMVNSEEQIDGNPRK